MTPVIPSSTSSISLIPGPTFDTKKINGSIRCLNVKRSTKRTLHAQDCVLPLSTPLRLFPHIRALNKPRFVVQSAGVDVDVNVAVEQTEQSETPDSPVSSQDSSQISEQTSTVDKTKQRSRPVRKSDMPPVKDEELVPGASFMGKVRSIQPFGAFIDFGAFTDGLVHVSRLSDGYVKDVANVVSVGQEVKVKLVEANIETGRIALTMRENESASGGDSSRPPRKTGQGSGPRRNEGRKTTKFVKGQDLDGTVKNLTRSGAFINLPEGEEGFLPQSEEADEGFGSLMGDGSSLEVGQEVKVRVLKIARGQVTLTMKKDEDAKAFDSKLQGKVFTATNPFLVAFRQNKDIASFLDEREKVEEPTLDEKVEAEVEISAEAETEASVEETEVASPEPEEVEKVEPVSDEEVKPEETSSITGSSEQVDAPVVEENVVEENKPEETEPKVKDMRLPIGGPESEVNQYCPVCRNAAIKRRHIQEPVNDFSMQVAACPQVEVLSPEDVPQETIEKEKAIEMQKEDLMSKPEQFRSKIVEGRIKKRLDELALLEQAYIKNDKDYIKSTIATIGENLKVKRFVRFNLGEGLEKRTQDFAAEVAAQTTAKKGIVHRQPETAARVRN
ncbi:nucleic acid-binding, OB-fold protein [Tanacetum coccineum]